MSGELVWPSGVAGAQCEGCSEFTVVRFFEAPSIGESASEMVPYCRECIEGDDDDDEF